MCIRDRGRAAEREGPVVVPHLLEAVRVPGVAVGSVLIANASASDIDLVIESVAVRLDRDSLLQVPVQHSLPKDLRYARARALLELLPRECSHNHVNERAFSSPSAPLYTGSEALDRRVELESMVFALSADEANGMTCLLYTSPSPRDRQKSRMPSSA